jgi:hypothetical protein
MPTTTNYGWTTPADTDLVKDGALAIRTLGSAIDTTVYNNYLAGAMISIASGTMGNSTTISSIPATYNDLILVLRNARPSNDGEGFRLRLNGNTGSVYANDVLMSQATYTFGATFMQITSGIDNTATNGIHIIRLYEYANSASTWKYAHTFSIANNNTTTTSANVFNVGSLSNITANIDSITFYPSTGNTAGGTYELYGIR